VAAPSGTIGAGPAAATERRTISAFLLGKGVRGGAYGEPPNAVLGGEFKQLGFL